MKDKKTCIQRVHMSHTHTTTTAATATAIILRPFYRSTCVSWHSQLRTKEFC